MSGVRTGHWAHHGARGELRALGGEVRQPEREHRPRLVARHRARPPWALAIASTIASPRPAPPAARVRAESARAKRSKIRSSASAGTPQPSSSTSISTPPGRVAAGAQLDRVRGLGVLDGVLEQRVERRPQALGVDLQPPGRQCPQPPGPRGDLRPAHEDLLEQRLELDLCAAARSPAGRPSRARSRRSMIASIRPSSSSATSTRGFGASAQQLEVAARDRHRRAELMRCVVDEPLLALEQRVAARSARCSATCCASTRRRACQTIATNIAAISGLRASPTALMSCIALEADR